MKFVWICHKRRRDQVQTGQRTNLQSAASYTPESYHARISYIAFFSFYSIYPTRRISYADGSKHLLSPDWNHGQKVYPPKRPKPPLSASVSCSNDSYANNVLTAPAKETGRKGEEIRVELVPVEEIMVIKFGNRGAFKPDVVMLFYFLM